MKHFQEVRPVVLCALVALILGLLSLPPRAPATVFDEFDADEAYTINSSGDEMGFAVAGIGDCDADGYDNVAIGAHKLDSSGSDKGKVYVPDTWTKPPTYLFSGGVLGTGAGDLFGHTVAGIGDVNDDEVPDFVVGAPGNDDAAAGAGKVYVISGDDGSVLYAVAGESAGQGFGTSVAGTGDLDNDEVPDFVVGAPTAGSGKVFALSGVDGSTIWAQNGTANERLGYTVAAAGDFNDDGQLDVVVGGPYSWEPCVCKGGQVNVGQAWVLDGEDGSTITNIESEDDETAAMYFGFAVAGGKDFNGDGITDVAIGSLGLDKVYVVFGSASPDSHIELNDSDVADIVISGETSGDQFGSYGIAFITDINDDGKDELAIGADRHDVFIDNIIPPLEDGGSVYLFYGFDPENPDHQLDAGEDYDDRFNSGIDFAGFGWSVADAGDVNDDGTHDIVIGAPFWDLHSGEGDQGAAFVFYLGD